MNPINFIWILDILAATGMLYMAGAHPMAVFANGILSFCILLFKIKREQELDEKQIKT